MTKNLVTDESFRVVAIDGGAASGKSSTARLLAERLHFLHVDTGTHYRAVALACLEAGLQPVESPALEAFLGGLTLGSLVRDRESLICLSGNPPPDPRELRSPAVNRAVSPFAALPAVRQAVMFYQQSQVALARGHGFKGIVMDGRDIGTVILPHADLKVFLVADPFTRQQRRTREGGLDTISDRDKRDSSRPNAPLRPAPDACVIDNSNLPLEAVVDEIVRRLCRT